MNDAFLPAAEPSGLWLLECPSFFSILDMMGCMIWHLPLFIRSSIISIGACRMLWYDILTDNFNFRCLKHLSGPGGATCWSKSHHYGNYLISMWSYQCDYSWCHHKTCWLSKEQFITDISLTEDISLYKYDMITSLILSHWWYDHINIIINVIRARWPCVITS